jgi:hypothetical protein
MSHKSLAGFTGLFGVVAVVLAVMCSSCSKMESPTGLSKTIADTQAASCIVTVNLKTYAGILPLVQDSLDDFWGPAAIDQIYHTSMSFSVPKNAEVDIQYYDFQVLPPITVYIKGVPVSVPDTEYTLQDGKIFDINSDTTLYF